MGENAVVTSPHAQRTPIQFTRPQALWARSLVDAPLRVADRLFGLTGVETIARDTENADASKPVLERVLDAMRLTPRVAAKDFERIPLQGPTLLCSNHPLGGADSTALLALSLRRRSDVKILTNSVMARFPFLAPHCIFVDPFGGADAARRNAAALRDALRWMKDGHLLIAHPAGEVSAMQWGQWVPVEAPWSTIPARLAISARAAIVPVWCEGTNSRLFHAAGLIHPRLRTALLPSEFVARCGSEIEIRIGRVVASDACANDAEALTRLVRGRSELLRRVDRVARAAAVMVAVTEPESTPAELAAEFNALDVDARLFTEGDYEVFAVKSAAIPRAMREIGRLREHAFRAVGEGSGNACDIDAFDETYLQLIVWNTVKHEIVGGYRLGIVAEITRNVGVRGLYSSTLFEYSERIASELTDAVELGRSFVRVENQRHPLALNLLWKGIGAFMFTRGLRRMFGAVSISNDYTSMSKELIIEFLTRHRLSSPFSKLVAARNPPARSKLPCWTDRETEQATADLVHVERLIEEIERGERAVPVLLRQYLRLNAKLLSLNVDHNFADALDALMLVDIAQIDDRILRHYAGDDGLAMLRAKFPAECAVENIAASSAC